MEAAASRLNGRPQVRKTTPGRDRVVNELLRGPLEPFAGQRYIHPSIDQSHDIEGTCTRVTVSVSVRWRKILWTSAWRCGNWRDSEVAPMVSAIV